MSYVVVWMLIAMGNRGYYTVPNIVSEHECHRLFGELKAAGWANASLTEDHRCIAYKSVRP